MQVPRQPSLTDTIHSPLKIANLLLTVNDLGISPSDCLHGTPLDKESVFNAQTKTSITHYLKACQNAIALAKNPELPFLCGNRTSLSSFGLLGFGVLCAPNLREAIASTLRYQSLSGLAMRYDWYLGSHSAYWSAHRPADLDEPLLRFMLEEHVTRMSVNLAEAFGEDARPLLIRLPYARPDHTQLYRRYWNCDVQFDTPQAEYHIDPQLLSCPSRFANAQTWETVCNACDMLMSTQPARDIGGKVKKLLNATPGQIPDMEAVASTLGMTTRTLRRHLTQENTSFSAIVDHVRKCAALDYLRSRDIALDDVAALLGFSEPTSFRRAFKKWTGQSPSTYRDNVLYLG
jgi:AraC-like DNA-binding protein